MILLKRFALLGILTLICATPLTQIIAPTNWRSLPAYALAESPTAAQLIRNVTTRPSNDTICQVLGYGVQNSSEIMYANTSYTVLGVAHQDSYISGALVSNDSSASFLNISRYLQDLPLWTSDAVTAIRARNESTSTTLSFENHASITALQLLQDHLTVFNLSLQSNGALVLPQNGLALISAAHMLKSISATSGNSTMADSESTAEIGNTFPALTKLAKALVTLAAASNSSVSEYSSVNWRSIARNCLSTGNHTGLHDGHANATLTTLKHPNDGEVGVWHINRCEEPLYYTMIGPGYIGGKAKRIGSNERTFHTYHVGSEAGVSIKIAGRPFRALTGDIGIVQLEYTVPKAQRHSSKSNVWMDLSFIDCGPHLMDDPETALQRDLCPMRSSGHANMGGWLARWINGDSMGCPWSYCAGTDDPNTGCKDAYMESSDDYATRTCSFKNSQWESMSLELISCPSEQDLAKVSIY